MGDFDQAFQDALKQQSWALYSVGMFTILLRMIARARRLGGIRHYQVDDYLMMFAGALFITLTTTLNTIAQGGGSNLYPPDLLPTFTPQEIQDRIHGSKIVIVSEQAMLNLIYTLKTCLLIMYTRLTLGLRQQRRVRWLAGYVALGWTATQLVFFTACRPFAGYWGVPPPDPQCTTLQTYALVQAVFNISSDVLMLFVPLPLVFRIRIPARKKAVLLGIFSMGGFVIVAAVLTKIFNLSDVYDSRYMLWYMREASVAVYVSNLPLIWPLLMEIFPPLRGLVPPSYHDNGKSTSRNSTRRTGCWKGSVRLSSRSQATHVEDIATPKACHLSPNKGGSRPGEARLSILSFHSIEMGIASAIEGLRCPGGESGYRTMRSNNDSREHVVTTLSGGIQVERTIVVREEDMNVESFELAERGRSRLSVYDWETQGGAQHQTDVMGRV